LERLDMRGKFLRGGAFLALWLLCVHAGCARQKYYDSSSLTILPGRGIPNVLELGMSLDDAKRATRDLRVERNLSRSALLVQVPSLGAGWSLVGDATTIFEIYFYVETGERHVEFNGPCYRGDVAGGLSFKEGHSVTRQDVVDVFGVPDDPDWDVDSHVLSYPQLGIQFSMGSNEVSSIRVVRKPPAGRA